MLLRDPSVLGPQWPQVSEFLSAAVEVEADLAGSASDAWLRYWLELEGDHNPVGLMTAAWMEVDTFDTPGSAEARALGVAQALATSVMLFVHPVMSDSYQMFTHDSDLTASNLLEDTVTGLTLRHKLSKDTYDILTLPWRCLIGPIHPDDDDHDLQRPDVEFRARAWQAKGLSREDAVIAGALDVAAG